MPVDNKSFYADLFSKPAGPDKASGRQPVPRPAPSIVAAAIPKGAVKAAKARKAVPDETPRQPQRQTPPALSQTPALPVALPQTLPAIRQDTAQPPVARARAVSPLAELIGDVDTHNLTPRQMANLSLDFYAAGVISFEDYALLAFQPELHPDYDSTIGALTGEAADPDRPRDFVRIWDDRAAFQRRHDTGRRDLIEQSERIASALRRIDSPSPMMV